MRIRFVFMSEQKHTLYARTQKKHKANELETKINILKKKNQIKLNI